MSDTSEVRGAPDPASIASEYVFTLHVECEKAVEVGASAYGKRRVVAITGGSFAGPRLRGEVLPGGADWQLVRPDGLLEIEARYTLRADDGGHISICNAGIIRGDDGSGGGPYVRTVVSFEAPAEGPHAWLNRSIFLGTIAVAPGPAPINVRVHVYRVI